MNFLKFQSKTGLKAYDNQSRASGSNLKFITSLVPQHSAVMDGLTLDEKNTTALEKRSKQVGNNGDASFAAQAE